MNDALSSCNFSFEEKLDLFRIISAILHFGNVRFKISTINSNYSKSKLFTSDSVVLSDEDNSDFSLKKFCKVNSI